jgi:orc1/cdc6 family replication initiation protein
MDILEPQALQPGYAPQCIIDREYEREVIYEMSSVHQPANLYIHGPHGTGKTLITRTALNRLEDSIDVYHVPCTVYDTQYKVLKQLYGHLTGKQVASGYHTAQLQNHLSDLITQETVIVLDDIDFLLENDGNDLLYYLSRIKNASRPNVFALSSYHSDLLDVLDDRTYSSLHPHHVTFNPYSEDLFYRILSERVDLAFKPRSVDRDALYTLASATTNLQLAFQWLEVAAHHASEQITEDVLWETRTTAVQQYRDVLLQEFTIHHHLLLEAIAQLSDGEQQHVYSGKVYDRYEDVCKSTGKKPVSQRRASDFIRHLELLGIIEADYYYGGEKGKTREIQLVTY